MMAVSVISMAGNISLNPEGKTSPNKNPFGVFSKKPQEKVITSMEAQLIEQPKLEENSEVSAQQTFSDVVGAQDKEQEKKAVLVGMPVPQNSPEVDEEETAGVVESSEEDDTDENIEGQGFVFKKPDLEPTPLEKEVFFQKVVGTTTKNDAVNVSAEKNQELNLKKTVEGEVLVQKIPPAPVALSKNQVRYEGENSKIRNLSDEVQRTLLLEDVDGDVSQVRLIQSEIPLDSKSLKQVEKKSVGESENAEPLVKHMDAPDPDETQDFLVEKSEISLKESVHPEKPFPLKTQENLAGDTRVDLPFVTEVSETQTLSMSMSTTFSTQNSVSPQMVSEQVVRQFIALPESIPMGSKEKLTINLHPSDLGPVEVSLEMTPDGVLKVTMVADGKALNLLQEGHSSLAEALQAYGELDFSFEQSGRESPGESEKSVSRIGGEFLSTQEELISVPHGIAPLASISSTSVNLFI